MSISSDSPPDAAPAAATNAAVTALAERLVAQVRGAGPVAVAFSGGVDSAVVAQAARLARGDAAVAVTAVSASLASGELEQAAELATRIGIRHEVIRTDEFLNPAYVRNDANRCYHCKSELYRQLEGLAPRLGYTTLLNGANLDDQGDHRPGMVAAQEHAVRSPLIECGYGKEVVRQLAAHWGLPVWDKPASPCLSSRVAYGEEVTPERLAMIDRAEAWLRSRGLRELRVRYHRGDLARVEIPVASLATFCASPVREELVDKFREFGFRYITLDLEGFRSGNLNAMISADSLKLLAPAPPRS